MANVWYYGIPTHLISIYRQIYYKLDLVTFEVDGTSRSKDWTTEFYLFVLVSLSWLSYYQLLITEQTEAEESFYDLVYALSLILLIVISLHPPLKKPIIFS